MKNALLKCFLIWYLLAFTKVGEFYRVPYLVAHYTLHQQLNTTAGFLDFLSMHYSGKESDGDDTQDQQLPFKSVELGVQYVFLHVQQLELKLPIEVRRSSDVFYPMIQSGYAFSLPWGIWHPPRTCVS